MFPMNTLIIKGINNVFCRLQRDLLWEIQRMAGDSLQRMQSLRLLQVGTSPSLQAMQRIQASLRLQTPSLCQKVQRLLWRAISRKIEGDLLIYPLKYTLFFIELLWILIRRRRYSSAPVIVTDVQCSHSVSYIVTLYPVLNEGIDNSWQCNFFGFIFFSLM